MDKSTITITFGDQAENHVGMQKIGKMAKDGFTVDELARAKEAFEKQDYKCDLVSLGIDDFPPAAVLIVRNGVKALLADTKISDVEVKGAKNADDVFAEQTALEYDKKAKMYGRVVNKSARYNLCFDDKAQEPDYENGKGRIVAFDSIPLTKRIRDQLPVYFGEKAKDLTAEGNYYYDVKKCGIGWHGDAERKRVIALRLGASLPLHYQWFQQNAPVGKRIELMINHGDIYVMSEKATGFDWKKRKIPTLRHAAGCEKFLAL